MKEADIGLNSIGLNTVAQYRNRQAQKVDVAIVKGIPTDVTKLRVADCLYFAGADADRAYADYVGHVEMVYAISGQKVTLCGHGSGRPRTKDLRACCRTRYATKTNTNRGNRGLIAILRFIPDDKEPIVPANPLKPHIPTSFICTAAKSAHVRSGPGTSHPIVGILVKDERLPYLGIENIGWYRVLYKNVPAYVSTRMGRLK